MFLYTGNANIPLNYHNFNTHLFKKDPNLYFCGALIKQLLKKTTSGFSTRSGISANFDKKVADIYRSRENPKYYSVEPIGCSHRFYVIEISENILFINYVLIKSDIKYIKLNEYFMSDLFDYTTNTSSKISLIKSLFYSVYIHDKKNNICISHENHSIRITNTIPFGGSIVSFFLDDKKIKDLIVNFNQSKLYQLPSIEPISE